MGFFKLFKVVFPLSSSWAQTSPESSAGTSLINFGKKIDLNLSPWIQWTGVGGGNNSEEITGFLEGLHGRESAGTSPWVPHPLTHSENISDKDPPTHSQILQNFGVSFTTLLPPARSETWCLKPGLNGQSLMLTTTPGPHSVLALQMFPGHSCKE